MKWTVGVTTVMSRKSDLLPRTLASIKAAGFPTPRVFADGLPPGWTDVWEHDLGLHVTSHHPHVGCVGNWVLGLWELYLRDPTADRFAMFQDDVVCSLGVREYLDVAYSSIGATYLNLYTVKGTNTELIKDKPVGWYPSDQLGKGAQALVFDLAGVQALLSSSHMANKPYGTGSEEDVAVKGRRNLDGAIISSMRKVGYQEWVHNPSLVQHVGDKGSSMPTGMATGSYRHTAPTFRGEDFDCVELLR